jgi:hypothetical protein
MITSGQLGSTLGAGKSRRKKRKPTIGIPDATKPIKRKPIMGISDAPTKPIPVGAKPVKTPVTGMIDPKPNKPIPVGAKPTGTYAMPDAPKRKKPVNPSDPNLQKMKPTGGTQLQGSMSSPEALKPNDTSTMQAAANIASQFKKRITKKI